MRPRHLLVMLLFAAVPAQAAMLRTVSTLQGPRVYLRDLFDDAGGNADRVLGPGPGPGGRIVVEARQLKAIARQFGVDWEPASSADRAVLEWPGHPMRRELVLEALRGALVARGAAPDCEIEIPGFAPPLVPEHGGSPPVVTQLDYDHGNGRFTAILSVAVPGMDPIAARTGGQVLDVVVLPVLVTRMPAGSILSEANLRPARVHVAAVQTEVARDQRAVAGMQLRRPVPAGVPIALADLMHPLEVNRGDPVRMQLDGGGLSVSGEGIALEPGSRGDKIRVRNVSSQAVIEAVVVSQGAVRVLPGSAPINAQARLGRLSRTGG